MCCHIKDPHEPENSGDQSGLQKWQIICNWQNYWDPPGTWCTPDAPALCLARWVHQQMRCRHLGQTESPSDGHIMPKRRKVRGQTQFQNVHTSLRLYTFCIPLPSPESLCWECNCFPSSLLLPPAGNWPHGWQRCRSPPRPHRDQSAQRQKALDMISSACARPQKDNGD